MTWNSRDFRYDWASIAAPIVALTIILLYQQLSYSDFWRSIDPKDHASHIAGAMMMYEEIVEIMYALLVGSVIGVCLVLKEMSF